MAKFVFTKVLLVVQADNLEDALEQYRKANRGLTKKALARKVSKGEIEVKRMR